MARKLTSSTAAAGSAPISAPYESTGGAGPDFEVDVVVQMLAALLAEETDRLLPPGQVPHRIKLQRRDGPRGFDDITVEAGLPEGSAEPVFVQAKRTFSLTAPKGDFGDYVQSLHARDLMEPTVPWAALIVAGKLTPPLADVQILCEWARSAESSQDFNAKCTAPGVLNRNKRATLDAVEASLAGLEGASTWRVLRRLRVAESDYADQASRDAQDLETRLAGLLKPGSATGRDLRNALRSQVLKGSQNAPTCTRASLLSELAPAFHFLALPRFRPDLDRLANESRLALESIDMSLGAVSLLRDDHVGRGRAILSERSIRLVGDAGCGKSMILARLAISADRRLVLKDARVSGRTWSEFAAGLGVTLSAEAVIETLGDRPGAILAVDGADRLLSSERREVVLDILRAVAASPTRGNWRLVTTGREVQARDLVTDACLQVGIDPGERMEVGGLDDHDADYLALAEPSLRSTLARTDLGGRNRDLFSLREALLDPDANAVGTEVGLAARWATRGSRIAPSTPSRDAAIAQIGAQLVTAPEAVIGRANLDPDGVSALLNESSLRSAAHRDALAFSHDVYEDWTIARTLDHRRSKLPDILRAAGQPLWWLRAVRLTGQIVFEVDGPRAWLALVKACAEADDLDPVWWRTLLVAPLYSEHSSALLAAAEALLLADDALWLERLVDTLHVLESRPDDDLLHRAEGSAEERQRIAAALPIPNQRSWFAFLNWALPGWSAWPGRLVPKLAQVATTWLRATEGWRLGTSQRLISCCADWLKEIEEANAFGHWEERRRPFGCDEPRRDAWEETATLLRKGLAYGVGSAPDVVKAYLIRASGLDYDRWREDLLNFPRHIPTRLPSAWADFCISHFVRRRPRVRDEIFFERFNGLSFNEGGLESTSSEVASPIYAGFDQLFEASPDDALRMLRRFEKRAAVFYRHFCREHDRKNPRPVRLRFPWGEVPLWGDENTYRWARGALGPEVLASAYMAMDLWMGRQAANGRPLEDLFRLVLRPCGLNASLCACINVAFEHINTPGQIDAIAPILAEPRVWNFEVCRYSDDLTLARQPLVPYYVSWHRPAILEVGARYAKRQHLRVDFSLAFLLMAGQEAQDLLVARVAAWSPADLADFDDQLQDAESMASFERQLERYRADLDRKNIQIEEMEGALRVTIEPPEPLAEQIAALDGQHVAFQVASSLMVWGSRSLEENKPYASMDIGAALKVAQGFDARALFSAYTDERFNDQLAAQGVAATAAAMAKLAPDEMLEQHRHWVTETLIAAANVNRRDLMFDVDEAFLSHDPGNFAAIGLTALVRRGGPRDELAPHLLMLATDRRHHIAASLVAGLDFEHDPPFAWAIFRAAFADTVHSRGKRPWEPDLREIAVDRGRRRERAYKQALCDIRQRVFAPLPVPPPNFRLAWVWQKSWRKPLARRLQLHPRMFGGNRAKTLLAATPLRALAANAQSAGLFRTYLSNVAQWAKDRSEAGPNRQSGRYPFELMNVVVRLAGRLACATAEASAVKEPWRDLAIFEDPNRNFELVGDFLEGMSDELVASGGPPGAGFWSIWNPASARVLGPPGTPIRSSYRTHAGIPSPVMAAGFVGPYSSPIPPDWPYVETLLPAIDAWAERTHGVGAAAEGLLRFCDRLSDDEIERYALAWIERWLQAHHSDAEFWEHADVVNRAAAVALRLPDGQAEANRIRVILAKLADHGSLVARQALAAFASRRPSSGGKDGMP